MGDVMRYIVRECRPFKPGEHTPTNAVAIMVDAEDYDALRRVAEQMRDDTAALFKFIQEKYPNDWKDGVYQFKCPYHVQLAKALAAADAVLGKVQTGS